MIATPTHPSEPHTYDETTRRAPGSGPQTNNATTQRGDDTTTAPTTTLPTSSDTTHDATTITDKSAYTYRP